MKLPPYVQKKGPSLYYVKKIKGKPKWTRLCAAGAAEEEIHGAIWKLLTKGPGKLSDVMDDYIRNRLPKLAYATQKDYQYIINDFLRPIFGGIDPDDLTSQDVAVYLENADRKGKSIRGNREIAVLSSIYNHGMRIRACKTNPTYGVRRNPETPRTYYVTDRELRQALRAAKPPLRYLLWATYLTGFRQKDMRNLTRENLTPDGIKVIQSKDGKHEIREWTESLRKVVRRSLERTGSDYVFSNHFGRPWTTNSIQCAMQRVKSETGAKWCFHDLRAKAESDHPTGLGLMRRYSRARKLKAVR